MEQSKSAGGSDGWRRAASSALISASLVFGLAVIAGSAAPSPMVSTAYAKSKHRLGHVFPIPGPHSYREGDGEFGAARPGRVHQGKDVWAACGEKLVAVRAGVVRKRGYHHALYGHNVVIDADRTKTDYFYSHLLAPAEVKRGERVRTGQRIGDVGASGNARSVGCMLHFELWPTGFRNGAPVDPEPKLRRWDGWS